MKLVVAVLTILSSAQRIAADEPHDVWPELAPGETTRSQGEVLPFRPQESPPVTRVVKITRPTFTVHPAKDPNGYGAVILPGGGFGKVVPDKEGTEAATWLNGHGFTAFVLSYRTVNQKGEVGWKKGLQDAQRTMSIVRARAAEWGVQPDRLGLVGFSAGGQVASRLLSDENARAYDAVDDHDNVPYRPDFALLIYPWNIYDTKSAGLVEGVRVPKTCPPTFLVHTDDDRSSSLGAVLFYAGLKQHGIAAALHVYGNGGHGYGLRDVDGSQISSWPNHAAHWLKAKVVRH